MLTIELKGIDQDKKPSYSKMENFVKLKEWFVTRGGYVASDIEQRETEVGAGLCASVNHAEG